MLRVEERKKQIITRVRWLSDQRANSLETILFLVLLAEGPDRETLARPTAIVLPVGRAEDPRSGRYFLR